MGVVYRAEDVMDSLAARAVAGTKNAVTPFFSPDSQRIGFSTGGTLKKISINGGAAVSLTPLATNAVLGAACEQ